MNISTFQNVGTEDAPITATVDYTEALARTMSLAAMCSATVYGELAFDRRGCSPAIDVTDLDIAQLLVVDGFGGSLVLESLVADDTWHVFAQTELGPGLTTLRIPTLARIVRARLTHHPRRLPGVKLVGRIEGPRRLVDLLFGVREPQTAASEGGS